MPIAAPSANRFGHMSPTTAAHVLADLGGRVEVVLDAGPTSVGVESTVIDVSVSPPLMLRSGRRVARGAGGRARQGRRVPPAAAGHTARGPALAGGGPASLRAARAGRPGRGGDRHWAHRGRLWWQRAFASACSCPQGCVGPRRRACRRRPTCSRGALGRLGPAGQHVVRGPASLDAAGLDVIVCPMPPEEGLGLALRDRLAKAARPAPAGDVPGEAARR